MLSKAKCNPGRCVFPARPRQTEAGRTRICLSEPADACRDKDPVSDAPEEKNPQATFGAKPGGAHPRPVTPAWRATAQPPAPALRAPGAKAAPLVKLKPRPMAPPPPPPASPPPVPPPASPPAGRTAGGDAARERGPAVSDELAAALAKLATEYAPLPMTSTPFASVKEKEAEAKELRLRRRKWLAKVGASLVVALGLLLFLITRLIFDRPTESALEAEVAGTAQALILQHSSGDRPLELIRAVPILREKIDSSHLRYGAEVTMRLRVPLYGPALSNGTVSYRQMQESLEWARNLKLKHNFFPRNDGPPVPALPRLIQLIHRAGETMTVRVPFEAKRFGWIWRIRPAQLSSQSVDRRFEGLRIERFHDAPYLIFGVSETMPEIRNRMKAARVFVTAVAKEVQRNADAAAVAEPTAPAGSGLPIDPDKPAVEADKALPPFDPNKPAVEPDGARPPVDPNKPAVDSEASRAPVDPNKPAVEPGKIIRPALPPRNR